MKIAIIGSTGLRGMMFIHKKKMEEQGHEVMLPIFDDDAPKDSISVVKCNLNHIEWADVVHIIWDGRSIGTWGDFCMCVALGKDTKTIYMEEKTIRNAIIEYSTKEK
jgi:hypothetical protein